MSSAVSASVLDSPAIALPARRATPAPATDAAAVDDPAIPSGLRSLLGSRIAFRWSAVVIGLALTSADIAQGSFHPVWATAICLYLTSWRSMRELHLGSPSVFRQGIALSDLVLFGIAAGLTDGLGSPFAFCVLTAAGIAALGWGQGFGLVAVSAGLASSVGTAAVAGEDTGLAERGGQIVALVMILSVVVLGSLRARMAEADRRRALLSGQVDALTEANDLLQLLNRVARTIPSLELGTALEVAERQIYEALDPRAFVLAVPVEGTEGWAPVRSKGIRLPDHMAPAELPWLMAQALASDGPVLVPTLGNRSMEGVDGSGLAIALRGRTEVEGVLVVEHGTAGEYSEHHARLLEGLAEAVGLTLDNANQFRRLRLLSATEERTRIARDLHDRLGQWLTYITLELERIQGGAPGETGTELSELRGTVQMAIDEFRETLRQLRTAVDDQRPLALVGGEVVAGFERRTRIESAWESSGSPALAPIVENEVLRILQEGLNNVEKHAKATNVSATWRVDERGGELTIVDNGRGFDPSYRKTTSYGLTGMEERASIISAQLEIASAVGEGTTIRLFVPREVPA